MWHLPCRGLEEVAHAHARTHTNHNVKERQPHILRGERSGKEMRGMVVMEGQTAGTNSERWNNPEKKTGTTQHNWDTESSHYAVCKPIIWIIYCCDYCYCWYDMLDTPSHYPALLVSAKATHWPVEACSHARNDFSEIWLPCSQGWFCASRPDTDTL